MPGAPVAEASSGYQPIPMGSALQLPENPAESEDDASLAPWTPKGEAQLIGLWQVQRFQRSVPPGGKHDRISVNRIRGFSDVKTPPKIAVLYLPGTFMNGRVPAAADLDPELAPLHVWLASGAVAVYALDYRTHTLDPNSPLEDPRFSAAWNSEAFVQDALSALELARADSGIERIFVMGFSRGVAYTYAVAAARPDAVAGLIALDGSFKRRPAPGEELQELPENADVRLLALLEEQGFLRDVGGSRGWAERRRLMTAAISGAKEPGELLSRVLYGAWGPGALARPAELPEDLGPPGVTPIRRLAAMMIDYDRYFPAVQNLEAPYFVSVADAPHTAVDDGWPELSVPTLYFGTLGLGSDALQAGIHSAAHAGGDQVEIHLLERYGHLDVLVAQDREEQVLEPIQAFLRSHSHQEEAP